MEQTRLLITSARGGQGKSTIAAGLAYSFAKHGIPTALVDLDCSERSLDMYLGCQDRVVYDIGDFFSGKRTIAGIAISPDEELDHFYFFPGLYKNHVSPNAGELDILFSALEQSLGVKVVIVDTSVSSNASFEACAAVCDKTILTIVPSLLSCRSTSSLKEQLEDCGTQQLSLIVNQFSVDLKHPSSPDLRSMIDETNIPLLGIVPKNELFTQSQDEGIPAIYAVGCEDIAQSFDNITARLLGQHRPLLSNLRVNRKKLLS